MLKEEEDAAMLRGRGGIQGLQDQLKAWSDETFGSHERRLGMIAHLKRECDELAEDPGDIKEMADCFLLLLDIAAHGGYSVADLMKAASAKFTECKKRKWGSVQEDGSVEHIKDNTPQEILPYDQAHTKR
jgi:dATP/dGTP diphosphohydrolase